MQKTSLSKHNVAYRGHVVIAGCAVCFTLLYAIELFMRYVY